MGSYKYCFCFTRRFRWSAAEPPPDVKETFAVYAEGGALMSPEQLRRFLADQQGEVATAADAEWIVERTREMRHRHYPMKFSRQLLSLDDFFHYLFSADLNLAVRSQVHKDMTAPLSHYYIYASHNSYLKGNQLSSDSSDVPIINALKRGVRVIELDMWPNSKKDDIDIVHGRTLTSPVPLIKCLRSIKEYAFMASPYPVIITLEDHLTSDLQAKVAEMVTQTFGDMLYYPKSESMEELPSPEALTRRILLSTKPPKEYLEAKSQRAKDSGSQKRKETTEEDSWGKEVTDFKVELHYDKQDGHNQDDEDIDDDGEDVGDDNDEDNKLQQNAAPEYKNLITIRAGKPKGHLIHALKGDSGKVRRLSLSEQQLETLAASHGTDIVRFTQKNMLRIYPKGTRVTSSNYNPILGWMHGAQMVALNMQGYGRSLWLMHGFYKANGGCGYVRKPDFLMKGEQHGEVFDPKRILVVKEILKVKVYLGDGWIMDFKRTYFDTYSPPDFYARVGIAGVPADCIMKKTRTIEDEWAPVWDEEFIFPLTVPELALLRVEVHEYDMSDKDDFGGQTCLPVQELRPGIRCVPLCDRKGTQYKSVKLLMGFSFS